MKLGWAWICFCALVAGIATGMNDWAIVYPVLCVSFVLPDELLWGPKT